jgi:hypothetical protein
MVLRSLTTTTHGIQKSGQIQLNMGRIKDPLACLARLTPADPHSQKKLRNDLPGAKK